MVPTSTTDSERLRTDELEPCASWAHSSGWVQLSGERRTLTCVVSCRDQARALSKLLPILSDTLTECGYPWELIAVNVGSTDGTAKLLAAWAELPGFRELSLSHDAAQAGAFSAGSAHARGDAVILVDASLHCDRVLIPRMVMRWESGARMVVAVGDPESAECLLDCWDGEEVRLMRAEGALRFPTEAGGPALLDRSLLQQLLDTE